MSGGKTQKHEMSSRKVRILATIVVAASALLTGIILSQAQVRASENSCLSSSGAGDVESVKNACADCYDANTSNAARGTLWVNGSGDNRNSNTIDISPADDDTTVTIYLWGQVYSCGQAPDEDVANWASYIWFGREGQMKGDGSSLPNAVDYIVGNDASKSLYRGNGPGATHKWYTPTGQNISLGLDVKKFKEDSGTTYATEWDPEYGEVEVWRAKVSINRCFDTTHGKYLNTSGTRTGESCYGDNSEIILRIITPDEPDEETGGVVFWPQSSVASVAEKDVPYHKEWTTDDKTKADGDVVSLQLSTDFATAKADFEHKMHAEVDLGNYVFGANDTWDGASMCTEYQVTYADGSKSAKTEYCAPAPGAGSSTDAGEISIPGKQGFVINVPGKAIEKIEYEPKVMTVKREEVKYSCPTLSNPGRMCSYNPKRYKYYGEGGSGRGDSAAEIEYVAPNEPDDTDGPSNGAGASGQPMYAGETTTMRWWARAMAINTRRIVEYQSTVFEVQWDFGYNAGAVSGDLTQNLKYPNRSQLVPCDYWGARLPLRANNVGCTQLSPDDNRLNGQFSGGFVGGHLVNGELRLLVVPDYVGDKYCNSFGYKWQYYWGVKRKSSGDQWDWQPENQTYWTHYDAACRTIAKKPSVAVWDGGVFTNGGILTSLAPRYEVTTIGTLATNANAAFGSWTEHLGVANGLINNFGTGGSLALGSATLTVGNNANSSLTIRNDIPVLGMAGIKTNPTLTARLGDYLGGLSLTERFDGDVLNITNDYLVAADANGPGTYGAGAYGDIYQLPQRVIYAPNATKVNISGDVTMIDAWLIAPNATINTCAEYNVGSTETRPAAAHVCDKPLQFAGPVLAQKLELRRTGGADVTNDGAEYDTVFGAGGLGGILGGAVYTSDWQKYTPAEVFNLSADDYLWAYAQAGRYGSSYTETFTRELPPRY